MVKRLAAFKNSIIFSIIIHVKCAKTFVEQPIFSTTKLTEYVLNLKVLDHFVVLVSSKFQMGFLRYGLIHDHVIK